MKFLKKAMNTKEHNYETRLETARRALRDEYLRPHDKPWIVTFSGGKDSSLLTHLVVECILRMPPNKRRRRVYVCNTNTLVELPPFQEYVNKTLMRMAKGLSALALPIEIVKLTPPPDRSFWVCLLGRGYSPPKWCFRWCTERLKIQPMNRFTSEQVARYGGAIVLLGTRRTESAARAKGFKRREKFTGGGLIGPDPRIKGCLTFTPLRDLTTDDVWTALANSRPPWGGDYRELIHLYECAGSNKSPSVTGSSARFGCWVCTLVSKNTTAGAMINSGFIKLKPLIDFRNHIKAVAENPGYRNKSRRSGRPGLGSLTIKARKLLLGELLDLQRKTGFPLISNREVHLIHEHWEKETVKEKS